MNSSISTCPFLLRSTSLRISWSAFSSMWTLMLCGEEKQEQGSIRHNEDKRVKMKDRKATHVQNLLDVDGGDESFALFVKLMETLLVPVTQMSSY